MIGGKKTSRVDKLEETWDVSRRTVERLINGGELDAFKVDDTWRIKQGEVEEFERKKKG
jgi:excisionase family DNA binding protein